MPCRSRHKAAQPVCGYEGAQLLGLRAETRAAAAANAPAARRSSRSFSSGNRRLRGHRERCREHSRRPQAAAARHTSATACTRRHPPPRRPLFAHMCPRALGPRKRRAPSTRPSCASSPSTCAACSPPLSSCARVTASSRPLERPRAVSRPRAVASARARQLDGGLTRGSVPRAARAQPRITSCCRRRSSPTCASAYPQTAAARPCKANRCGRWSCGST